MKKWSEPGRNEQGSIMVVALVILVLLTVAGLSVTRTSDVDIQIARNEQEYVMEFYTADSAWRHGVQWLDTRAAVPPMLNTNIVTSGTTTDPDYLNVRNYSAGGADVTDIDPNIPDGTLGVASNQTNYWYKVAFADISSIAGSIVPGSGKNYREYDFRVRSNANQEKEIEVTVGKVFKTGY